MFIQHTTYLDRNAFDEDITVRVDWKDYHYRPIECGSFVEVGSDDWVQVNRIIGMSFEETNDND